MPSYRASRLCLSLLALSTGAHALSVPFAPDKRAAAATAMTDAQMAAIKPYVFYESATYCRASTLVPNWNCGAWCDANPDFKPVAAGGDNSGTQPLRLVEGFVGYDPKTQEVVVSHQGTDLRSIEQLIEDFNLVFTNLDSTLFPGMSSDIKVYKGFQDAFKKRVSATDTLAAVQKAMSTFNTKKVVATGHSLGSAMALLESLYYHLNLPDANVRFFGTGLPRVGNQAFADFIDAAPLSASFLTNARDIFPRPAPERQENGDQHCSVGEVSLLHQNVSAHNGPYGGINIGNTGCNIPN
ncbi:lipase [Epithele typhae]|uniref:lipase n=1 Tax=Epithele typhae TaxID=378194 RepID=UPI00200809E1|nr:lipase [Epithele typhae]KAH9937882.1 lipase [Epithele typhae]